MPFSKANLDINLSISYEINYIVYPRLLFIIPMCKAGLTFFNYKFHFNDILVCQ